MRTPKPKLYLLTPRQFEPAVFADALAAALAAGDVACVRLRLGDGGEKSAETAIAAIKPVCDRNEVALIVEDAFALAARAGLDGVHLTQPTADIRAAREAVGDDGVVGAWCGASRHQGLVVGERGVDYAAFGPLSGEPAMLTGPLADLDLFEWWQSMIELPVVAEGGVTPEIAASLVGSADFVVLDPTIWDGDAAARVAEMQKAIDAADDERSR